MGHSAWPHMVPKAPFLQWWPRPQQVIVCLLATGRDGTYRMEMDLSLSQHVVWPPGMRPGTEQGSQACLLLETKGSDCALQPSPFPWIRDDPVRQHTLLLSALCELRCLEDKQAPESQVLRLSPLD